VIHFHYLCFQRIQMPPAKPIVLVHRKPLKGNERASSAALSPPSLVSVKMRISGLLICRVSSNALWKHGFNTPWQFQVSIFTSISLLDINGGLLVGNKVPSASSEFHAFSDHISHILFRVTVKVNQYSRNPSPLNSEQRIQRLNRGTHFAI
jgi:hypothetical protein